MEIGIGLIVAIALFAIVVAVVGRKVPGIGLFTLVLFMIGFGLALFVPVSLWWRGAGWVWENLVLIRDFILARLGGFSPEQAENPTARDVVTLAGVCAAGVFTLIMIRKVVVLALGLIAGVFLQVLLKFIGIPLPFG